MSEAGGAILVDAGSHSRVVTRPFVQLCVASLAFYASSGVLVPLLPLYVTSIGASGVEVGLVVTLFSVSSIASRPFAGRFVDRGFISWSLLIGGLLYTIGSASFAFVSILWLLYFFRIVQGLGSSYFTTATGTAVAALAPRHRRGAAAGIFSSSQSLGIGVAPALTVILLQATSFSVVFGASALLALISLLLSTRVRPPKIDPVRNAPLSLYSKSALMPSAILASIILLHGAATTFLPVVALEKGMGNPGMFFTVYGVAVIACRLLAGPISDRFGRSMVIVPGLLMMAVGTLYFSTITDLVGIMVSGALFGIGTGLTSPGLMALTIDLAHPEEKGSAMATLMASFDLGLAIGAVLGGFMIASLGFSSTFMILSLSPLLALLVFCFKLGAYSKSSIVQNARQDNAGRLP